VNDRPLLIANPAAGGGKCGKLLADAERRLINIGMKADVVRTSGPGHATQIAAEATDRSTILVAGGDGTFFEVVNGVMSRPADQRPALGTIPLGTGNSFLRDFNIRDADGAFTALAVGRRSTRAAGARGCHQRFGAAENGNDPRAAAGGAPKLI